MAGKFVIASDIHGSASCCRKLLQMAEKEFAENKGGSVQRILLLGDILYHGPRNDLPEEYAPKEVISMLNEQKHRLLCVRGNCEAEVDQMVLDFPVMADYCILPLENRLLYATHGHIYHADHLPPLMPGDVLLHGHTHILTAEKRDNFYLLNPGSVSIPKGGNPKTYAVLENDVFTVKTLEEGRVVKELSLV